MAKSVVRLPSFDTVKHALEYLKALGTAAETHGLLCALFAAGAIVRKQAWVNSILTQHVEKGDLSAQDARQALERLYEATESGFKGDDLQLQLLLPTDDAPMALRIEGLAEWCQGFLAGLKLVNIDVEKHSNPEVHEALQDMIQIAMMSHQGEKTGDTDAEHDLVQLVEYIRMAVMLIHAEQQRIETKQAGVQGQDSQTRH